MSIGIGDALREAREQQQRELTEVAQAVRVRTDYLQALEEERFDAFGGEVYAKGFLRQYAAELGLDPEPLLERYRREVSTEVPTPSALMSPGSVGRPSSRRRPPGWLAWVVVAVAVVIGLAAVGSLGGGRVPEVASPDDEPGDEAPEDAAASDDGEAAGGDEPDADGSGGDADGGDGTEDDDVASSGEEAAAPADDVQLLLALEEEVWLRVFVDGALMQEGVMPPGETLQYEAEEEVEIRFGNAGGVRIEHNGEDLGTPGARGEAITVTFTPEGAETEDGEAL